MPSPRWIATMYSTLTASGSQTRMEFARRGDRIDVMINGHLMN